MATVPEAQKPHTNVERLGFITAVFLFTVARKGVFMKANVVLQRIELQRTELNNAIAIVSRTMSLPSTPFDKSLWKSYPTAKPPPPIKPLTPSPSSSSSASTSSFSASTSSDSNIPETSKSSSEKPPDDDSTVTPTVSWRETVIQEFEAKRKQQEQQSSTSSTSTTTTTTSTSKGSDLQPKRKKLRQTTLLF